jgi:hypothetical protein
MLSPGGKDYQSGYHGSTKLSDLEDIRWLDTLDLEVAGDEGENVLAAVLVRLFRKLEESSPVHSKDCEAAVKELEDLATDIGIAWEGNLQARAGALDPDTFSAEVMRTQRARLRINERLKDALDKLATNDCYGCSSGTLFLLPVDDFYLKPAASLHLLRLLRMISIPRLFFLVMGDIKTVEALFIEKSLADWTAVAGTRLFAERTDRLDEALTRARELRARYLRKLLPPGQRADIEAMDWYEALDFEVGGKHPTVANGLTLERILVDTELDSPIAKGSGETRSLLTFLVSPTFSYLTTEGKFNEETYSKEKEKREKRARRDKDAPEESVPEIELKKQRSAYTALQILDATPREMMDLGSALREVRRQREEFKANGMLSEETLKTPVLLLCVRDIVNLVREEQSFLNEKEQQVLEGILPTRSYSPEDINFEMDRLCLRPSKRTWKEVKKGQLWVRDHRSWDLTVNRKFMADSRNKIQTSDAGDAMEQLEDDPFAKLPPRPAAWFVLLHDLAWTWNRDSVTGNLVERLCQEVDTFRSTTTGRAKQHEVPFPGWVIWCDEEKTYEHFPMPPFETIYEIDRFLQIWSRELKPLMAAANPSAIASLWALAGWIVLADEYQNYCETGKTWFGKFVATKGHFSERFEEFGNSTKQKSTKAQKPRKRKMQRANGDKVNQWAKNLADKVPQHFR